MLMQPLMSFNWDYIGWPGRKGQSFCCNASWAVISKLSESSRGLPTVCLRTPAKYFASASTCSFGLPMFLLSCFVCWAPLRKLHPPLSHHLPHSEFLIQLSSVIEPCHPVLGSEMIPTNSRRRSVLTARLAPSTRLQTLCLLRALEEKSRCSILPAGPWSILLLAVL